MTENLLEYMCAKNCLNRWSSDKDISKIKWRIFAPHGTYIHTYIHIQNGPKWEHGHLRLCDCRFNAFRLYLFTLLRTLYDVICGSEFVLFNNRVIFVLLFGKTSILLLCTVAWVEETKDSLILVTCLQIKSKCSVRRLRKAFLNKQWYLACISIQHFCILLEQF